MRRLEELLESASCRALLVLAHSSRDPFLAPFAGPARLSACLFVAPREAAPRLGFLSPMERGEAADSGWSLLTPEELDVERWNRGGAASDELWAGVAARALELSRVAPGRVALAGHLSAGLVQATCERLAADGWSFVPGEPLLLALRKRKPDAELERIRAAAAGAREAFERVAEILRRTQVESGLLLVEGAVLTVGRLRQEIAEVFWRRGLDEPEGNLVAAGAEAALPHTTGSSDRVLHPHESLVVDLFPRSGGLYADCTRTFCVGEPPGTLARAHARVAEALALARSHALVGTRGWDLQEIVCEHLHGAGFPTPIHAPGSERGYVHGLGHGVGYEVHELPSFRQEASDAEATLEVGDVFTLEPGLYEPDLGFAVRLEDLYHLGPHGLENLTPLPYELDPHAW